ncbi:hypothetical protein TcWFU_005217 [Taenia crassiceps]|uniref:Uncharacterized protein n=1 Tax=Taenia crassiceps TaxID=6207 RepID=A0ABR4QSN5_9CEST
MDHAYVLVSQQQQPPPPLPPLTSNDSIAKFSTLPEALDGSVPPKLLPNHESGDHMDHNHPLSAPTSSEVGGGKYSDSTMEGSSGGGGGVAGSAATVMTTDS